MLSLLLCVGISIFPQRTFRSSMKSYYDNVDEFAEDFFKEFNDIFGTSAVVGPRYMIRWGSSNAKLTQQERATLEQFFKVFGTSSATRRNPYFNTRWGTSTTDEQALVNLYMKTLEDFFSAFGAPNWAGERNFLYGASRRDPRNPFGVSTTEAEIERAFKQWADDFLRLYGISKRFSTSSLTPEEQFLIDQYISIITYPFIFGTSTGGDNDQAIINKENTIYEYQNAGDEYIALLDTSSTNPSKGEIIRLYEELMKQMNMMFGTSHDPRLEYTIKWGASGYDLTDEESKAILEFLNAFSFPLYGTSSNHGVSLTPEEERILFNFYTKFGMLGTSCNNNSIFSVFNDFVREINKACRKIR